MQLLRAVHQTVLDKGSWDTASLLLPTQDPCHRELFGATQGELETIIAYQDALKKVKKGVPVLGEHEDEQHDPAASSATGGGGKSKGKDKKKGQPGGGGE